MGSMSVSIMDRANMGSTLSPNAINPISTPAATTFPMLLFSIPVNHCRVLDGCDSWSSNAADASNSMQCPLHRSATSSLDSQVTSTAGSAILNLPPLTSRQSTQWSPAKCNMLGIVSVSADSGLFFVKVATNPNCSAAEQMFF